jgi:hypothetical protein
MSLALVALLIVSSNECASSYKPLLPKFLSTKLESLQAQSSKVGKAFGSLVIAATLVNFPLSIDQVNAVDRYNNKLNAPTAIGTRVNSDAESLLRYGKLECSQAVWIYCNLVIILLLETVKCWLQNILKLSLETYRANFH